MAPAAQASSGVASLVASIKQHKKFRQLAAYSVQCLGKVITAPHVGWERNLKDAYDNGALASITDVLQRHSGDDDVYAACISCLSTIATVPKYAAEMVEGGTMMQMLDIIMKNPDNKAGVKETLLLLETVASNNPDVLLAQGFADACARLVANCPTKDIIVSSCLRVMEKLNKVAGGSQALIEVDAVKQVMSLLGTADASVLEPAFRLLERLCRSPEHADYIRVECNGLQVLVSALESRKDEKTVKLGGRLLAKLASGSVSDLVGKLEASSKVSEKEFLTSLLANLALEEENADKIVAAGGITALMASFEVSKKASEAAAKALGRLAVSEDAVEELFRSGAASVLVKALDANRNDSGMASAVTSALARLAPTVDSASRLARTGGVEAVIKTMVAHPEFEANTLESLTFIDHMATQDQDMTRLVELGAISGVSAALKAHVGNPAIQLGAVRALIYMSYSEATVASMAKESVVERILPILASENKELVVAAMYLATSLALVPATRAKIGPIAMENMLAAISKYARDSVVRDTAEALLAAVVDEDVVAEAVADIDIVLEDLMESKSKVKAAEFKTIATKVAAYACSAEYAEMIIKSDGISSLVKALNDLSTTSGIPDIEGVLQSVSRALVSLAASVSEDAGLNKDIAKSGAVKAAITSIKANPKLTKNVTSAVAFLEIFGAVAGMSDVIAEEGGVEACASAMRANSNNGEVVASAVQTLLQVASTDKGAVSVAKHGGTRQLIATVHANVGTPNFSDAMEKSLALLTRVSTTSEGAEMLVKQGGVDAVIEGTEYLSRTKNSSALALASARVLSRLMTKDDVEHTADQLNELGAAAKRNRVPAVDIMKPVLSKVGHMANVGNFAADITAEGGAKSLSALVSAILSKGDEAAEAKADALPLAFKALANIAKSSAVDPALGIVQHVATAIESSYGLVEGLECLANIGAQSEGAAVAMCNDGRTLAILVETLRSNIRNNDVATACFTSIAALSSYPSSAALVAATAANGLVSSWVDDNIDDASPETLEAALRALGGMANSPYHAAGMLESGTVELVKNTLTKACTESAKPAPAVLAAAVGVLQNLATSGMSITRISGAGALRRVLRAVTSDPAYVSDAAATLRTIQLLSTCASVPAVAAELAGSGATEVIVAGMNANGTSESIVRSGAVALQALGVTQAAGETALAEVKALADALESASMITEDIVAGLGDAVQRLSNFLVIPGVVTPATAPTILTTLSNAVALLAEAEAKPTTLAAGFQAVGRCVELGGASTEAAAGAAVATVLDAMAFTESPLAKESGVYALGQLAGSKSGLQAITANNVIEIISEVGRTNAANAKLQATVVAAITKVTSQTSRSAASLVATGGSATLTAVVQANANDASSLTSVLTEVSAVQGGDEAIYDVIASSSTSIEVIVEALRVLRERAEASPVAIVGNARRVAGLARALSSALALQGQLTAASDMRTKLLALRMADNTLGLLSRVQFEATGAPGFFAQNGIDNLMQLLGANVDDDETVARITAILRSAMSVATAQNGGVMAQPSNMGSIVGTLRYFAPHQNGQGIVADCLEIMGYTARVLGADACGVDRDAMRAAAAAQVQFPSDARVRGAVTMLQSVMQARFSEADAQVRAMDSSLKTAAAAAAAVATIQELVDASGRTYYYNTASSETTWEMPASYAAFKNAMASAQTTASKQEDDAVTGVDINTINTMVNTLNTHMRNVAVSVAATQTLATLAANETNADAIARSGGIRTLMAAAMANQSSIELIRQIMILMERLSRVDQFKEQIADAGGVDIITQIAIGMHVGDEEIALKALATMANLAYSSETNIALIMKKFGVKSIEKVLQTYPMKPRVLENAMCALSNLMYGSDENKSTIGQTCGDEVSNIIRDHPNDANLFKMALRALGNLSFCDENIRFIVEEHHACKSIVSGMRANAKDEEAQQLAMEVIGNFASLEEPVETDAEGNIVNGKDSISSIILREAGCAQIIANLKAYPSNSTLIKAGLDALANIANDVDVTEVMAKKQNLVPAVIEVMQANDWDVEVITRSVAMLGVMTYSKECLKLIAQLDGIQVLLSAMEQHGSSSELLTAAQVALTNLAASEDARTAIRNMEGVSTILALLEANLTDKNYVAETCKTLTRLCADDRLSASVAERGMHILMAAIDRFNHDAEFLTVAFRLLGHLAFVESNLTIIVQHNGISKVIAAISSHPESQPLMVRSIQTLDNIAMANKENAAIVIDEGGRELIQAIMETFEDDEEVLRYGSSALLSMSALENLSKSAEITAKAALAGNKKKTTEDKRPVDPLAAFRNTLSAGKVMKVWTKGSVRAAHVVVSPDFKSIVWQEVGTQKKLGAMDLRSVASVRAGNGDGHKKGMLSTKTADPELTFVVVGDRSSLDLECTTVKERALWVEALSLLHTTFRTNPSAL